MITAQSKRPAFPARQSLLDAEAEALVDAKLISGAAPKPVTPKAQRRVSWDFASPEDAMACLRTPPLAAALDFNATSPVRRPSKAWPIMNVEESNTGTSGAGRQSEEEEAEEEEEHPLRPRSARAFWPTPANAVAPQHTPTSSSDSFTTIAEAREAGRSARAAAAEAAAARTAAWQEKARAAVAVLTAASGMAAGARVTVDADAPDATPAPAPAPTHAPVPAPPTSPPTTPGVRSLGFASDPYPPPAAPKKEGSDAFEGPPRKGASSGVDAAQQSGGSRCGGVAGGGGGVAGGGGGAAGGGGGGGAADGSGGEAVDGGGAVLVAVQALQAQLAEAQATMRAQSNQISQLSSYMVPPRPSNRQPQPDPSPYPGLALNHEPNLCQVAQGSPCVAPRVASPAAAALATSPFALPGGASPRPSDLRAGRLISSYISSLQQQARHEAACSLGAAARGLLACRAARRAAAAAAYLQAAWRRRAATVRLYRSRRAATVLQSAHRARSARAALRIARRGAAALQSAWRGLVARRAYARTATAVRAARRLLAAPCAALARAPRYALQRRRLAAERGRAAAEAGLAAQRSAATRREARLEALEVEVEAERAAAERGARSAAREGEQLQLEASAAECAVLRAQLQTALAAGEQLCSQLQSSAAECGALNEQLMAASSAPAQFAASYFGGLHRYCPAALPMPGEMLPGAPPHGAAGFVWRLADFAALGGGAVSSPPFEAFGGEWSLWVYPHGHERKGKLSVFLHAKKSNRPATVVYHLGLLAPGAAAPGVAAPGANPPGAASPGAISPGAVSRRSAGAHFGEPGHSADPDASLTWGVRNLADLLDVSMSFLHEGCLTVFAVIESVQPESEAHEVEPHI